MVVQLTPALEQRLEHVAAKTNRSPDELAQQALDGYLKHIEDLTDAIREGEESAKRDGWIAHDEVIVHIEKRFPKSA